MEDGESRTAVGVALSGGGHRASLWAAGALLGLVDADAHHDVVSIASVSGGSIANGVVAAHLEYSTTTRRELEGKLQPAIREWTHDGLFFPGPTTDEYVARVVFFAALLVGVLAAALVTSVGLGREWPLGVVAVASGVALLAGLVGGLVAASRLPSPQRGAMVAGATSTSAFVAAGVAAARVARGWTIMVVIAVMAVAVAVAWRVTTGLFARRSAVVDAALGAGLLADGGDRVALVAANRKVHHVFCATNLATADHVYFSPRLVYGNMLGYGTPKPDFALSTAVQASACLPGAFAPRSLPTVNVAAGLRDTTIVLTDGGVYDNMADQWEFGFRNRAKQFRNDGCDLSTYQDRPAQQLVVVNASKAFTHQLIGGTGALAEFNALLRCKDVLYDVSTSVRRRYLVDMFKRGGPNALAGVLVHITQTPQTVPDGFAVATDTDAGTRTRAELAQKFIARLEELEHVDWKARVEANAGIPTTLGPIGATPATDLLHHAFLLARINAYVVLNRGTLPDTTTADTDVLEAWGRHRFERLCEPAKTSGAT